jgi:rRNA-processing protein FCF1
VILDSNFLLVPSQFRLDIFEELTALLSQQIDPVVLSPTYEELVKIAAQGAPKMRRYASLALGLTKKCRLVPVERRTKESTDDLITRIAAEWKTPVATNDRDLRRRLREVGVAVIYLRQKSRLEVDGNVP